MDPSLNPSILLSNPEEEVEIVNRSSILATSEESRRESSGMSTMTVPSSSPRLVRQPSINQGYSVINPKAVIRQESKPGTAVSPIGSGGASGDWHTITDAEFPGLSQSILLIYTAIFPM